jgi:AcrR family transcriptional regulator
MQYGTVWKTRCQSPGQIEMTRNADEPRSTLDRDAWVAAASKVLATHGVEGVRVEDLAKRLSVTKGSFYWHFKGRQDLLLAVLESWKEGRIRDIVKQTKAEPGKEREQIHHVIDVYRTARNSKGIAIELAVREWARRDPAAAAVVKEVDAKRLDCAARLFVACGTPEREAISRSMLLYAYVFGQSLMMYDGYAADPAELKTWIDERIAR